MNQAIRLGRKNVLLLVDLQNDFCPGGALSVPRGDEIVPLANRLAQRFEQVVLTQDWHPPGHLSFASSHPGSKAFDTIVVSYGPQVLWPDHCVQASSGARLHADLAVPHAQAVLRKGSRRDIDSYSAFRENDRTTKTGLAGYLREREIERVFIAGLAFDFCVRFSAEDAQSEGFSVVVIEDACRAIDTGGSLAATWSSLNERGIVAVEADAIG